MEVSVFTAENPLIFAPPWSAAKYRASSRALRREMSIVSIVSITARPVVSINLRVSLA